MALPKIEDTIDDNQSVPQSRLQGVYNQEDGSFIKRLEDGIDYTNNIAVI
jgi:hypothetical protein